MASLKIALSNLPLGSIKGDVERIALRALEEHWDELGGSSEEGTSADKLHRAEDIEWAPPVLSFILERHGGTVNGSSRAETHYWSVNVKTNVACITKKGHRQLGPQSKRLDVKKLAREVSGRILAGKAHETLAWGDDKESVAVRIAKVIPETNQQTTVSRRKRFYTALDENLGVHGWEKRRKGTKIDFVRCPD